MATSLQEYFPTLGFLGAGNMAEAILRGTVGRGALRSNSAWACDVLADKLQTFADELGIQTTDRPADLFDAAGSIVLAVKPQDLPAALDSIADRVTPDHLLISIAAGMPLSKIAQHLPEATRLVRVMPNTPALVGTGAAAVAAGTHATDRDRYAALALFGAVGVACEVDEAAMDAVTALSGSGPAYVFRFMEILKEAGIEMGLEPAIAQKLTLQTFLGAARLAVESGEEPAELRRRVTSKGGTTAAALAIFEANDLAGVFRSGVLAARDRSIELAK